MPYQSINPATGKVLKTFKELTAAQLETSLRIAAIRQGGDLSTVAGVAILFISRIDIAVDDWIAEPLKVAVSEICNSSMKKPLESEARSGPVHFSNTF